MRPINLEQYKEDMQKQMLERLDNICKSNVCESKVSFNFDMSTMFKDIPKARLLFTAEAYVKLYNLTQKSPKEVAAHGTVKRMDNVFVIEDLFMYPQTVTIGTVKATDDYGPWTGTLDDDTFNAMRFQYHSHVNAGVKPSSVDTDFYKTMLTDVEDFYIFMIFNKHGDRWINIYDVQNNLIYDDEDVLITIMLNSGETVTEWILHSIEKYVEEKTYTAPTANNVTVIGVDKSKETDKSDDASKKNRGAGAGKGNNRGTTVYDGRRRNDTGVNKPLPTDIEPLDCRYHAYPIAQDCMMCYNKHGYYPCIARHRYD